MDKVLLIAIVVAIAGELLLCGVAAHQLAVRRKRDAGGWALLGFIFGPIAVMAAACMTERVVEAAPTSDQAEKAKSDEEANRAALAIFAATGFVALVIFVLYWISL